MKSLDWMSDALCAQTDPDLWHPQGSGQHVRKALKICATCPVLTQCGEHAQVMEDGVAEGRRHGAWGGQSAHSRSRREARNTARDQTILRLTDRGMTSAEIADQLDISDRTVLRVKAARQTTPERSVA